MSSDVEKNLFEQEPDDSEDEMDWEEVDVPVHLDLDVEEPPQQEHFEITLKALPSKTKGKKGEEDPKKKGGITHEERLMRISIHKIHTVVLLANAKVRNTWITDELLQARLMSLTPMALQNQFAQIHPSRVPDQGQRGRMFERAMQHLVQWWSGTFFEVLPSGHIRNRTWDEVQSKLESFGLLYEEGEIDDETLEAMLGCETERIRGPKSLMKHALNRSGSRDVSAQLFTSLCRALGIPARLVVSLQSVPWQASVGKPKPKYVRKDPKGKGKAKQVQDNDEQEASASDSVDPKGKAKATSGFVGSGQRLDGASVKKSEKAKGKEREKAPPVIKLRKQKEKGRRLGSPTPSTSTHPSHLASPDPTTTPPVFWTEVFSRPDSRWVPVDPIRGIVNKRKAFDPTPRPANTTSTSAASTSSLLPPRPQSQANNYSLPKNVKQENRMLYVIAFEEDGHGRDVTRRYAREYNAKIAKHQGGSSAGNVGGKARQAWWESVMNLVKRPFQLHRDDLEDEELAANQMMEGMPTTIAGFKDHPLYVLPRHLKQTEVIHPPPPETPEVGKFRGEPVYPRSSVVPLKSAETWMRTEGRIIKPGCQPLKTIKARPNTLNRVRELEVMKDELRDAGHSVDNMEVTQGLYARSQTELYIPPPIIDGKIPKNNFGNIDLYVPSMLPKGAVHIPFKGTAKIAKKLGLDYAEAVTGFEFRKRRANAVVEGVVVAAENESALLEAYWEAQRAEEEKARAKKEEKALRHWIKLVQGLRIRQRLQAEYADRGTPSTKKAAGKRRQRSPSSPNGDEVEGSGAPSEGGAGAGGFVADGDDAAPHHPEGGGFLVEADDVVQAFHLPKYNPLILASSNNLFKLGGGGRHGKHKEDNEDINDPTGANGHSEIDFVTYDLDDEEPDTIEGAMDVDIAMAPAGSQSSNAPKTMQEMLEAEKKAKEEPPTHEDEIIDMHPTPTAAETTNVSTRLRARPPAKTSGNAKTIAASRPPRTVSAKKRKRAQDDEGGIDESEEEENTWAEADAEEDSYPGEDDPAVNEDEDEDDAAYGARKSKKKKSPRKKVRPAPKPRTPARTPRGGAKAKVTAAAAPPTDRVLRSRKSKLE